VSIANNQKWKVSFAPLHNLFDHWLHCYGLFEQDKKGLEHLHELTYEDYIQNPDKCYQEIAHFIGTRVPEPPKQDKFYHVTQWRNPSGLRVPEAAMENVTPAHNEKYFKCWSQLLNSSPLKHYYRYIAVKYEPKFMKYGFSVIQGFGVTAEQLRKAEQMSATTGAWYCLLADASALVVRTPIQTKGYIKRKLREYLPESLKLGIKRALRKTELFKEGPEVASS
jgi:Sulfotransferase domain